MSEVTVIIPTLNRPKNVLNLIGNLQKQSLDKKFYRVLLIDNGSDATYYNEIKQGTSGLYNVELHQTKRPGLHAARHLGVELSQSNNLVFCDDDILPNRNWLSCVVEVLNDKNIGMIASDVMPDFAIEPEPWLSDLWDNGWTNNPQIKSIPPLSIVRFESENIRSNELANFVWGCNFPVRKDLIQECGGFNPDGFKESLLLFRGDGETKVTNFIKNHRYKIEYAREAYVHHVISKGRMSKSYFYKRGFAQGISKSYSLLRSSSKFSLIKEYFKSLGIQLKLGTNIPGKSEFLLGQKNGFLHHQKNYLMSKELRLWVNNNDYL